MQIERLSGDSHAGTWALAGEFDLLAAAELHPLLKGEMDGARSVVLDLAGITFIDSTGVGVLIAATKRASRAGVWFALRTNASEPVMRFLTVSDVRERFHWVSPGGEDDGTAGVREPRRPRPSDGSASAASEPSP